MIERRHAEAAVVIGLVVGGIATAVFLHRARGVDAWRATADEQPTLWVEVPEDYEPGPATKIEAPDQSGGEWCRDGLARFIHEASWESRRFPQGTDEHWRTFDALAAVPGLTDEISWGRADCEGSVGEAAAWSVGGGSVGGSLSCEDKDYPPQLGEACRSFGGCRVRTSLQYLTFDAGDVPYGVRLTFDYKAKLPPGAIFRVGVGDFGARTEAGFPILRFYEDFEADTSGEWRLATTREFPEAAGINELVITFIYEHDPAVEGGYGIFIDNVHADAKFRENPPPCPSPPTPIPTPTHTPTQAPTTPPPVIFTPRPDTPTPVPTRQTRIELPVAYRLFALPESASPLPTAPTVTPRPPTEVPPPSDTPVPTPSDTPRPSDTPTPTVTPTFTPLPQPDVQIDKVFYVSPGTVNVQRVILKNFGTGPEDISFWSIFGRSKAKSCSVPEGIVLDTDEEFHILAGRDAEDAAKEMPGTSVACDGDRYIFTQHEDEVQLFDRLRNVVDRYCWTIGGPYLCSVGGP